MHIGVIGGGRMGKDVFDIFSRNGFYVTLYVRRPEAAAALDDDILGPLRRRVAKGGPRGQAAEEQLARLKVTSRLEDLQTCDLVNENISEELEPKLKIFRSLEQICSTDCIFSSDSSFLTPDRLAAHLEHPERMIGLHFFYPTRLTSFVEVIPAPTTSPDVQSRVLDIVGQLKVRPILCRNVPGFLVNRMIPAFYIEGVLMLEEGYFTASAIDQAVKGTLTHLGPLESCDMIGLDLVGKKQEDFPGLWRDGWIDPPLLPLLVSQGRLGTKSGAGIYQYLENKPQDDSANLPKTERFHNIPEYSRQDVIDRLYYSMVIEAFRQLDLEVAQENDIDATLKEILGFKQGPIDAARKKGLEVVRQTLQSLADRFGPRFTPRGTLASI